MDGTPAWRVRANSKESDLSKIPSNLTISVSNVESRCARPYNGSSPQQHTFFMQARRFAPTRMKKVNKICALFYTTDSFILLTILLFPD